MRARSRTGTARACPALALLLAACTADAPSSAVTRDSAGVAIVENLGPAAESWSLTPEPALVIGADPDDSLQSLYDVGGVTRLADGRIVLTDGGTRQVRVYSAAGDFLTAVGRNGEGPGEFRSLSRPYRLAGDSLLIYDFSLRRLSVLDPLFRFARDFRLQQIPDGEPVSPVLVIAGGEILAGPGFSFGSGTATGSYRGDIGYLRFRMDGAFIDSVGRFPGAEHFVFNEGENAIALTLPFQPRPRIAATADGFVFGDAGSFEIGRYSRDGRVLSIVRMADRVAPFTAARKQQFREGVVAGSPEDQRPFFERLLAAIPMPDVLPAHSNLVVDALGDLWVRDFAWEDQETVEWTVFDAVGSLLATAAMPARFEVQEIGPDWVLGVWRDELGIESVRLHGLRTGG